MLSETNQSGLGHWPIPTKTDPPSQKPFLPLPVQECRLPDPIGANLAHIGTTFRRASGVQFAVKPVECYNLPYQIAGKCLLAGFQPA